MTRARATVAATAVVGGVVLSLMLRAGPGSARFYVLSGVIAAVWTTGALLTARPRLGRVGPPPGHRPIAAPFFIGLALVALFLVGGLVIRSIGPLDDAVRRVMSFTGGTAAGPGLLALTVVAGLAEELFFRGVLYDVIPDHPVLATTVVYTVATAATGNVMLAFAAALLGVVTGLQRRATNGVLAPMITHVVWSVGMLYLLPLLFAPA